MGFFSRRSRIVDLTEDYKYEKKHPKESAKVESSGEVPVPIHSNVQEASTGGFFNFFGGSSSVSNTPSTSSSSGTYSDASSSTSSSLGEETLDADEKRRRLAKRLKDMTDRIEDMSNTIYKMQQRIELLEKKMRAKDSMGESE